MSRFMAECPHCGELFDDEDAWFEHGRLQAETERLQAECALLRAAIRRLCNIYVVDDYYDGQLREERLDEAVNRAIAAHQSGGAK